MIVFYHQLDVEYDGKWAKSTSIHNTVSQTPYARSQHGEPNPQVSPQHGEPDFTTTHGEPKFTTPHGEPNLTIPLQGKPDHHATQQQ